MRLNLAGSVWRRDPMETQLKASQEQVFQALTRGALDLVAIDLDLV